MYDPASITAYWGKRPRSVATRIVQLLSVAGGFLSRVAWDVVNKKVKEVIFLCPDKTKQLACIPDMVVIVGGFFILPCFLFLFLSITNIRRVNIRL